MKLGRQWDTRFEIFNNEFERHLFTPILEISDYHLHRTKKHLKLSQVMQEAFFEVSSGETWGDLWDYGWFRFTLNLDKRYKHKRVVAYINIGKEMLVWLNQKEVGSIDKQHHYITLTPNACGNEGPRPIQSLCG